MDAWRWALFVGALALTASGCGGSPFEAPPPPSGVDGSVEVADAASATDAGTSTDATASAGDDAGAPASTFACGQETCTAPEQYCFVPGPLTRPPTCRSTPSACLPNPGCACVEQRDTQCVSPSCKSYGLNITVTCKL
jgi:hypothetical protein